MQLRAQPYLLPRIFLVDKDGIRMESVGRLAMVLTLKDAAGSVKGSDVNRQQRPRAGDRRTFVLKSRL